MAPLQSWANFLRNRSRLLAVGLVVAGVFPIQVAAFFAATLVLLTRALHMHEAYRAIEWKAIFLVAAVLPVGLAMERTGAALLLAQPDFGTAVVIGRGGDPEIEVRLAPD